MWSRSATAFFSCKLAISTQGVCPMKRCLFASFLLFAAVLFAQNSEDAPRPAKTTRPAIRGTQYAVVSMKPQASQVAERILREGGNAFDAVVAGQAVLGPGDFPSNGGAPDVCVPVT